MTTEIDPENVDIPNPHRTWGEIHINEQFDGSIDVDVKLLRSVLDEIATYQSSRDECRITVIETIEGQDRLLAIRDLREQKTYAIAPLGEPPEHFKNE